MKSKKILSLCLIITLFCTLLSGCMGLTAETKINADDSGTMEIFIGFTEEFLEQLEAMGGETTGEMNEKLVIDGVTYIGMKEMNTFDSIEGLNKLLQDENTDESVDKGNWKIEKLNGDIYLTVNTTSTTGDSLYFAEQSSVAVDELTDEQVLDLAKTFKMLFTFEFPQNVTQISGSVDGITIKDNVLSMDLVRMNNKTDNTYVFTTAKGVCEPPVTTPTPIVPTINGFTDVSQDAWYYNAVTALAEGGLVEGVGNNMFNPHGNMTYAAFCQVLARAKFLPIGTEDGYWASKAIKSCIDAGYIFSIGEVNAKNYDVQINREVAIYAIMKARQSELFLSDKRVSPSDIPDYNDISPEYADTIVNAYKYEITSGVDDKGTFLPKAFLSRAELCQLFYNLKWTNPLQNINV